MVLDGKLVGALSRRNIMSSLVVYIDLLEMYVPGDNLTHNFPSERASHRAITNHG